MIQIKINKKINDYSEKFLGLNAKTILIGAIVLLIGIPLGFQLSFYIGKMAMIPVMILAIITAVLVTFKHNELTAVECIKKLINIKKTRKPSEVFKYQIVEGMVKLEQNSYIKLYELSDVNYETLSDEEREKFFINYFDFLNFLEMDVDYQVTVVNKKEDTPEDAFMNVIAERELEINKRVNEYEKVLSCNDELMDYKRIDTEIFLNYFLDCQLELNKGALISIKHLIDYTNDDKYCKSQALKLVEKTLPSVFDKIDVSSIKKYASKELELLNKAKDEIPSLKYYENQHNIHVKSKLLKSYRSKTLLAVRKDFLSDAEAIKYFKGLKSNFDMLFESINVRKDEVIHVKSIDTDDDIIHYINSSNVVEEKVNLLQRGDKVSKSYVLDVMPTVANDQILKHIKDLEFEYNVAIKIKPFNPTKGINEIKKIKFAVESDKRLFEKKYANEALPEDIVEKMESCDHLLDSLRDGNQQLFNLKLIVTIFADNIADLTNNEAKLRSIFARNMYQLHDLTLQMKEGYLESLPVCLNAGVIPRNTLLTEGVATFMPFTHYDHEVEKGGIFYGVNSETGNPIIINETKGLNHNGFVLGTTGGGKSFATKNKIGQYYIGSDNEIIIIDPEGEYEPLVNALGGQIVDISNDSTQHINLMEYDKNNTDYNSVVKEKLPLILAAVESMLGAEEKLTGTEKSSINRVLLEVYEDSIRKGETPVLQDIVKPLYKISTRRKSKSDDGSHEDSAGTHETTRLHQSLETYTYMSQDLFNHQTSIELNHRLTLFKIGDVSDELKALAMVVILDFIWKRITTNKLKNKFTNVYIDEIHLLFKDSSVTKIIAQYFKRVRKYGGMMTGITQNISDLFETDAAKVILNNCHYLTLLDQASADRKKIVDLFNLSPKEESFITNSRRGYGLMKAGGHFIPFQNIIDKENGLYKLFNTSIEDN